MAVLGHVSIEPTAYYLRWVPELAQAASDRFESTFGDLLCGGGERESVIKTHSGYADNQLLVHE